MARRGFFAELQHLARVAAKESERNRREAARKHAAAVRSAEQARATALRTQGLLAKANEAEQKRQAKLALDAHVEAMEAEAQERNEHLAETYEEIDKLLVSTLGVDDYVDLNSLRAVVKHPPFDRIDLETPVPPVDLIAEPAKPVLVLPDPPSGIAVLFGKKKHAEAVESAKRSHEAALEEWRLGCRDARVRRQAAEQRHAQDEARRLQMLQEERQRYAAACAARESEAAARNRELDELIVNLGHGTADAIREYVGIVLANSVYPEHFPVTHEYDFDASAAELRLRVIVPAPDSVPNVRAYKYNKSTDEIISTSLSQKEQRDRYANAIHQVALRSFHEVSESDRRGLINTISLEVGTNTIDPATGLQTYVAFVIAGAERETFITFNLAEVVPALTLERLGAAVSKNPLGLVATTRAGVRRS